MGRPTWADAELIRHESGRLLFADRLRRYSERGELVETKVRVWVPVPVDHVEARVQARAWFAGKKLDPVLNQKLFDEVEQVCLLARAIRTFEPPHPQLYQPEELGTFDDGCLTDIQERINQYKDLIDPRVDVVDEDAFWRLVSNLAKSETLLPLADIAPRALRRCIVRMAQAALRSPTAPSSATSSENSTPEH
jgi:hypothetical protein